ncbi:hypothetical protein BOTBODRAFT_55816 [Botryobasidium botryosum FD-172 SS1]|uniref:Uncharacterized protein n=1 Tax=Botryobasidium botryosum (strain FD-172 SS1) TaxID=930990 RepID=A0A067MGD8_BOTB1|nr:hypothetical protein BOTBODRAFT_55816 [Botryobasidium botryosum FD-172 SS1]
MDRNNSPGFYLGLLRSLAHLEDTGSPYRRHKNPVLSEHTARIVPLLDALAAICSHKEGEVYAVTMSLSSEKVTLFATENKPVSKKVTDYLQSVCDDVVEINRKVHGLHPPSNSSPLAPSGRPTELVQELKEKIYKHCRGRLKKRLAKRWSLLEPFILENTEALGLEFVVRLESLKEELFVKSPDFEIVAGEFDALSKLLASRDFKGSEAKWAFLEYGWANKNEALINAWKGGKDKAFAPHRCIAKLFSLHTHIKSIIKVALSRRLSTYLSTSEIKVVPVVPCIRSDIQVAPTMEDIDTAVRAHIDATNNSDYEAAVRAVTKRVTIPRETTIELTVHCECSLLAYHLQHPETRPLRYIGVSKPFCFACQIYFELYNQHAPDSGQRWYFKGGHGKLYSGWAELRVKASDDNALLLKKVREAMVETVQAWIRKHVRDQVKQRMLPGSTVASNESQGEEELDPKIGARLMMLKNKPAVKERHKDIIAEKRLPALP